MVSDGTVCGQHARPILGPALAVLAHPVAARESSELHLEWKWGWLGFASLTTGFRWATPGISGA